MSGKYTVYSGKTMKSVPIGSGLLAALAVLLMFGMLPFTQYLAGLQKQQLQVREFDVSVPPPQFTPPEPPPPEPPPESEPPPQLDAPPPQLSLAQLTMALNPGVGAALAGDFSLGEVGVSAQETMEQLSLFEISDLDRPPSVRHKPMLQFTPRMKREKKEGVITMEGIIQPDGSVVITAVQQSIDDDYNRLFKGYFEGWRYEPPTVAGKPVQARVTFENIKIKWQ